MSKFEVCRLYSSTMPQQIPDGSSDSYKKPLKHLKSFIGSVKYRIYGDPMETFKILHWAGEISNMW